MNTFKTTILLVALGLLALAGCSSPTPGGTETPSVPTQPPAVATPGTTATTQVIAIAPTAAVTSTIAVSVTIGSVGTPAATGAATTSAAQGTNPLDIILKAEQAGMSRPVRITTVTTGSAAPGTTVIEFVPPDRLHFVQSGGMEVISIKSQGTWFKLGNTWQPVGFDVASTVFSQFDPTSLQNLKKNIVVGKTQVIGPDTLNGQPMTVYSFTSTLTSIPGNYTSTSKLWVGADGLPYKVISDTPNPLNPSATIHTESTYQYDPGIKINPPS